MSALLGNISNKRDNVLLLQDERCTTYKEATTTTDQTHADGYIDMRLVGHVVRQWLEAQNEGASCEISSWQRVQNRELNTAGDR